MSNHKYNLRNTPQKNESWSTPPRNDKLKSGLKGEPVFKTPMTFSPRVMGDVARPSPSRNEIWKAQLGFDDSDMSPHDSQESEDEDSENKENLNQTCSMIEYQALVRELHERNAQRDDLVLKLKNQQEKNKQYKQRVERDELNKKQQIKILRKTHETSLQEKENLIRNLESIIEEHEGKITELQESLKGGKSREESEGLGLHRLVRQITDLQEKNTELYHRALTSENQLEELNAEIENLKQTNAGIDKDRNELQEEIIKLRSSKGKGSTDDQKLVHKLEGENDKLRSQVHDLEQQLLSAKSEASSPRSTTSEDEINKLKEENDNHRRRIATLEQDLREQEANAEAAEEVKRLTNENQALSQENRTLKSQLVGLQAKSPEVVTKIKTVEVESKALQHECESLKTKLEAEQEKSLSLTTKHEQLQAEYESSSTELRQLRSEHNTASSELKLLKTGQQSLGDNINQLLAEKEELASRIETLRVENDRLSAQLEESRKESIVVTSELGESRDDNARLQAQLEQLGRRTDDQQCQLAEAEKEINQRDADIEVLIKETDILKEDIQQKEAEISSTASELMQANDYAMQLKQQLQQYGEEVQQLQQQMELEIEELKRTQQENVDALESQHEAEVKDMRGRLNTITSLIHIVVPSFTGLKDEFKALRDQCLYLPKLFKSSTELAMKEIASGIEGIHTHNQELLAKYRKEMALRKKFHNELVELKGNIRVFCRVRPKIKEDGQGMQAKNVVSYDAEDDGIINVLHKSRVQSFELDRVFHAEYSQEQVYNEVTSLVTSCVDGYNVCIFAYGQTGSGKTYTMEGTVGDQGINQRALNQLFMEAEERSHASEFTIHVSVLEIYNEMIRDLLSAVPTNKLDVKMNPEGGVHVPGLTYVEVQSVDDVNEVFSLGHKNRATASTNMNEHSSRSHALLCIRVVSRNRASGNKTMGVLNLVDLAGSERVSKSGADGARLKEAQNINKSLSSLGDVIQALRVKQSFVPYRNSKLTYLLQDSLGGDSKTLMITQISPVERNVGETLASLNFAQRVRTVELGQASKKIESAEVAQLKEKLTQYEDLAQFQTGFKGSTSKLSPPNKIPRQK